MSKIICDVCGTDYPETAEQCPICGCANGGELASAASEAPEGEDKATRTYVKGGRFSKKNVNKRLRAMAVQQSVAQPERIIEQENPEYEDPDDDEQEPEEEERSSNLGLIIVVIVLLLAIAAVSVYIAVSIFGIGLPQKPDVTEPQNITTTAPTTEQIPEATGIPCTALDVSDVDIYLSGEGSTWQLTVTAIPENSTDTVSFSSTDETVVTVDPATGLVTAVGNGTASVIITCGDVVVDCPVKCELADTEPTTEATEPIEGFQLKLDKKDFTLFKAGATCDIYSGEVDPADITWTTDNDQVAAIDKGVVTAVGNGRTRVYGEYNGQKVSCWVGCKLPEEQAIEPGDPTDPVEPGETMEPAQSYTLKVNGHVSPYGDEKNAEVTITVEESFRLTVEDDQGVRQDVTWKASKDGVCSVDGRTITGESAGKVTLTAELNGETYKCIIVVK